MTRQRNTKSSKIEKSISSRTSHDIADDDNHMPIDLDEAGHGKALTPSDDRQSEITNIRGSRSSEHIHTKESEFSMDIKQEKIINARGSYDYDIKEYHTPIDVDEDVHDSMETYTDDRQSDAAKSKAIRSSEKNARKDTFVTVGLKQASQDSCGSGYTMPIEIDEHSNDSLSKVFDTKSTKSHKKAKANEDVVNINDDEDQDSIPTIDDQDFDNLVNSTFVIAHLHPVVDRKYLDTAGISILKPVLNIEIVNGLGVKTIISVWGPNANNVAEHIE